MGPPGSSGAISLAEGKVGLVEKGAQFVCIGRKTIVRVYFPNVFECFGKRDGFRSMNPRGGDMNKGTFVGF